MEELVDASSDKMVGANIQKYLVNVTGEGLDSGYMLIVQGLSVKSKGISSNL